MFDLTNEEREELMDRAARLHMFYDLGGAYPVPPFIVEWVRGAGLWIYQDGVQVYSVHTRNPHADICDDPAIPRKVLDALRRQMILDDLASI